MKHPYRDPEVDHDFDLNLSIEELVLLEDIKDVRTSYVMDVLFETEIVYRGFSVKMIEKYFTKPILIMGNTERDLKRNIKGELKKKVDQFIVKKIISR